MKRQAPCEQRASASDPLRQSFIQRPFSKFLFTRRAYEDACVHVGFIQLPESHGWIINSMSNLSSSFIPLLVGNKLSLHYMVKTTHLYICIQYSHMNANVMLANIFPFINMPVDSSFCVL